MKKGPCGDTGHHSVLGAAVCHPALSVPGVTILCCHEIGRGSLQLRRCQRPSEPIGTSTPEPAKGLTGSCCPTEDRGDKQVARYAADTSGG